MQGPLAVSQVSDALRALERDREIDVIIIARGGGSLEDLLPFSDEALCRLVSSCFTPIISAIGHEQDVPLIDLVADLRASTPTDAAKRVVPDVGEQTAAVQQLVYGHEGAGRRGSAPSSPGSTLCAPGRCWPVLGRSGRSGTAGRRAEGSRPALRRPACSTARVRRDHLALARVRALSPAGHPRAGVRGCPTRRWHGAAAAPAEAGRPVTSWRCAFQAAASKCR